MKKLFKIEWNDGVIEFVNIEGKKPRDSALAYAEYNELMDDKICVGLVEMIIYLEDENMEVKEISKGLGHDMALFLSKRKAFIKLEKQLEELHPKIEKELFPQEEKTEEESIRIICITM